MATTRMREKPRIILDGEMILTMAGESKTYRLGERDVLRARCTGAHGAQAAATFIGEVAAD
jgi:hypothetical protein